MKKALQYILIIIFFSAWGIILTNQESFSPIFRKARSYIIKPCKKPIKYSIGEVDFRFGISKDQFSKDIVSAEKIWEDPAGRNLFQYDPNAQLKINLIFDERQQQTLESEKLESNLGQLEEAHDLTVEKYNSLSAAFKQRLKAYNDKVSEYEARLNEYNSEVASWNSKGGAPKDKFEELKQEKNDLSDMYKALEKERIALNSLAQKTNNVVEEENKIVDTYNSNLDTYKKKYGGAREFEKGIYNGQEIDIYEYRENSDLVMTITHEFGHALGIDHLSSPQSIMYYLMGEQNLDNPRPTDEDLNALKSACSLN